MSNRNSADRPNPGQQPQRSIGNPPEQGGEAQRSDASRQESQQGVQGQPGQRSQVEREDRMSQRGDPGSQPGNRSSSHGMGSQGEGSSQRQAGTSNLPGSPNQSGSMGATRRDDDEGVSRR